MTVSYVPVTLRNNRLQQVVNAMDAGAGNAILRVGTTGMASLLSSITLAKPSATVANGVLTFASLPLLDPAPINAGVAANARIDDSSGNVIIGPGLTVGLSSQVGSVDIIVNDTSIKIGGIVSFVAGTITGT